MSLPKIVIIILNWNRPADTLECLESIKKLDTLHFDTIVVDNGSTDNSVALIKQQHSDITLLENGENLGFAEGNNRGIAEALKRGADYVLLLNNDTVVHPQLLNGFIEASRAHPEAGLFGAKIYFYDDPVLIWHAGGGLSQDGRCFHYGAGESDLNKKWETIEEVAYVCGCALFIKSEVIHKIGGLCPKFFLIWEEIDFCFRARAAGYRSLFVPKAKLWHKISLSFEEGNRGPTWQYFYWRNRLLFLENHLSPKKRFKFFFTIFPRELLLLSLNYFKEKSPEGRHLYKCAFRGIKDYLFRNFGAGPMISSR